jgi:hypothetical protein
MESASFPWGVHLCIPTVCKRFASRAMVLEVLSVVNSVRSSQGPVADDRLAREADAVLLDRRRFLWER